MKTRSSIISAPNCLRVSEQKKVCYFTEITNILAATTTFSLARLCGVVSNTWSASAYE